jgi:hypothetical protein
MRNAKKNAPRGSAWKVPARGGGSKRAGDPSTHIQRGRSVPYRTCRAVLCRIRQGSRRDGREDLAPQLDRLVTRVCTARPLPAVAGSHSRRSWHARAGSTRSARGPAHGAPQIVRLEGLNGFRCDLARPRLRPAGARRLGGWSLWLWKPVESVRAPGRKVPPGRAPPQTAAAARVARTAEGSFMQWPTRT